MILSAPAGKSALPVRTATRLQGGRTDSMHVHAAQRRQMQVVRIHNLWGCRGRDIYGRSRDAWSRSFGFKLCVG